MIEKKTTLAASASMFAERLLELTQHRWFGGRFPPDGELAVARLLLRVYVAAHRGEPIHKKAAAGLMGVEDVRTARKYVALAEEQGLLTAVPAPDDKRKELLQPTDALVGLLQSEFEEIAGALRGSDDGKPHNEGKERIVQAVKVHGYDSTTTSVPSDDEESVYVSEDGKRVLTVRPDGNWIACSKDTYDAFQELDRFEEYVREVFGLHPEVDVTEDDIQKAAQHLQDVYGTKTATSLEGHGTKRRPGKHHN